MTALTPIDAYHVDVAMLRQDLLDSFEALRRHAELIDLLEMVAR